MLHSFTSAHTARFGSGATILRSNTALDDDQLRRAAPSVFAETAHGSRSERYTYIPTSEVLNGLRKEGFEPFEVRQGGSRDDQKRGFTKHLLRLRHAGSNGQIGTDSVRELILLNSHDGTSSYQLMSGVVRTVCRNGLIVSEGEAQMIRVPHKGDIIGKVIEGAYQIIDDTQAIAESVTEMRAIELAPREQEAFAEAALQLRYEAVPDVQLREVIAARRSDDMGADLWRTFNRTQESLIRGGLRYTHTNEAGVRSRRETRPVNGIDGNVSLNRALWTLARKMVELKAA
jgi:Domain of unknown function (DUF932)